jgi:HD domain
MVPSDLTRLRSRFASYVSSFFTGSDELDPVFKLKQMHTERVCFTIRRLGRALQLSPETLLLAEAAALLHDVGRFSQFARYRTFRDKDSINHGRLGLRVASRHGLLSTFSPTERRHLAHALAYHNAAQLPPIDDTASLFFLKLLRDADKLDIWRVVIGHYSGRGRTPKAVNEFELSGNGFCSPPVLAALKNGRVVPIDSVRSVCDAKLLYISWVYDLNFPISFRETVRGGYLERLSATIPRLSSDIRSALQCASDHAARSAGGR